MNFEELTQELSALYRDLKSGKVRPEKARELNNTAVNLQSAVRLGLLNARLRNETPDLDFFKKKAKKGARRG